MTLSARLLALVLLMALPVLAIELMYEVEARQERRAELVRRAQQAAELLAAQQRSFVQGVRSFAAAFARLPSVQQRNTEQCVEDVRRYREQVPGISRIGVVGPEGYTFCGDAPVDFTLNLMDRDYVRRALRERQFAASGFIIGRRTNEPRLNFAYPVEDEAGLVRGAVLVTFGLSEISREMASGAMQPGQEFLLVDRNGIRLASAPATPDALGRPLDQDNLHAALRTGTVGATIAAGVDGVRRMYGYAPVPGTPELYALVGFPVQTAYAAFDQRFWRRIGLIGSVFGLAALVTFFLGARTIRRPLLQLQGLANRMAEGNFDSRVPPDRTSMREVASLSESFNRMAKALQQRTRELERSETRLRATYENAAVGLAEVDEAGAFVTVNEALCRITGCRRDELVGTHFSARTDPKDFAEDLGLFERQVAGELPTYSIEKRHKRKDGSIGWTRVSSTAVQDENGRFLYSVRIIEEITERKEAEARQALLIEELNHRVKNTLATVQSLAQQSFRDLADHSPALDAFQERLLALSKAQTLLSESRWQGAPMRDLVVEELEPYCRQPDVHCDAHGPELVLPPRHALAFAMIFHELATNAVKYGALSRQGGRVNVAWASDPVRPRSLLVDWVERGGPPVVAPSRRGFGSRLIERTVAAELAGCIEVDYAVDGLRCSIAFPLDPETRVEAPSAPAGEVEGTSRT